MKSSNYIKPNNHPLVKVLFSLCFFATLTIGCFGGDDKEVEEPAQESSQQGDKEATEQNSQVDDNSMVIQAILDHAKMDKLLTEDMAPIKVFGKKIDSITAKKFDQPVELAEKKEIKSKKSTVLWFKRLNIKDNTAKAVILIKASGKKARFKLEKGDDGKWTVKKASVGKAKKRKKKKKKKKA